MTMARKVRWVPMDRETYRRRQREAFKRANRKPNVSSEDELERTRPTGCPLCKVCTLRERGGKVTKRCKWE